MVKGFKYVLKEGGTYEKANLENDHDRFVIPNIHELR